MDSAQGEDVKLILFASLFFLLFLCDLFLFLAVVRGEDVELLCLPLVLCSSCCSFVDFCLSSAVLIDFGLGFCCVYCRRGPSFFFFPPSPSESKLCLKRATLASSPSSFPFLLSFVSNAPSAR